MSSRIKGLVKWYNEDKKFGFISPIDGSKDVVVHFSAFQGDNLKTLFEGQKLSSRFNSEIRGRAQSV